VQGTRIYSTLLNPNLLAGYLIPIAPLALGLAFAAIAAKRYLLSIPAFAAAALIALATILTGSRGGYIAIGAAVGAGAVMVVARAWQLKPKLRVPLIILCVVLPLLLLLGLHFVPSFEQRLTSIFAGREHSSNSFRMNVWHSSIQMLKDNWWFGVGPGNQAFVLAYGLYMRSGFDALGTYCVPLEVAVESGVLGLAAFVVLIVSLCARGHLSFWSDRSDWQKWLTALSVASLVGMMAHGLVDTVFYRPQVQFIFWLLVALIVSDQKD
jgi:putative inorganic carbon (HCO3(-)) transporter